MITKVGDSTADKNMTGIEKIHEARQHISNHLPTITNDIEGCLISFTTSHVNIFRMDGTLELSDLSQDGAAAVSSSLHRPGRDGWTRRHGLQTTLVPTRAQRTIFVHAD